MHQGGGQRTQEAFRTLMGRGYDVAAAALAVPISGTSLGWGHCQDTDGSSFWLRHKFHSLSQGRPGESLWGSGSPPSSLQNPKAAPMAASPFFGPTLADRGQWALSLWLSGIHVFPDQHLANSTKPVPTEVPELFPKCPPPGPCLWILL